MGKSPDTSTVVQDSKGQTRVTIPRAIASALGLKPGQKAKWRVLGKGKLEVSF